MFDFLRRWLPNSENRQLSGGDSGINSYLGGLDSYLGALNPAAISQTAAVEFGLGMISRAFMLSEIMPAHPALTPLTLSMIARQTVGLGNSVFLLEVSRARGLRLIPVGGYEVSGGALPESWVYEVEQGLPSGDIARRVVPYVGVVHVRYTPRPSAPWAGVSPLSGAGLTAETLAYVERSLGWDAGGATGRLLPMPDGATPEQMNQIARALSSGKGMLSPIESTAGGFGAGPQSAPKADWGQKRFGPEIPATSISLRDSSALWILDAMGIPAALHTSAGAAQREAYRHFFTATVEPLGALIIHEISQKFETEYKIRFPERVRSDISALSRARKSFIDSGMDPAEADKIIGIVPR